MLDYFLHTCTKRLARIATPPGRVADLYHLPRYDEHQHMKDPAAELRVELAQIVGNLCAWHLSSIHWSCASQVGIPCLIWSSHVFQLPALQLR